VSTLQERVDVKLFRFGRPWDLQEQEEREK
jgi:hypothetical protein